MFIIQCPRGVQKLKKYTCKKIHLSSSVDLAASPAFQWNKEFKK